MSDTTILVLALVAALILSVLVVAAVLLTTAQFAQLRQMVEELLKMLFAQIEHTHTPTGDTTQWTTKPTQPDTTSQPPTETDTTNRH